MNLESKIEGLLFYRAQEISTQKLEEIFKVNKEEIESALNNLSSSMSDRGIVLIRKENNVMLGVNKELSDIIESIRKEEMDKELSKASQETLSIILYKNGISRSEIDYIRGVNSNFILRNLLVRGLVEKRMDEKDSRRFLYFPSFETLAFMGIKSINELPNYEEVVKKLEEVINNNQEDKND